MQLIPIKRQARGYTLVEILVALLLFMIGLVGLAGSLAASIRSGHVANVRTQATFLAQLIADSMRANPAAVISGDYEGTYNATTGAVSTDCRATRCNAVQLADYETAIWSQTLSSMLPNGRATIDCDLAPTLVGVTQAPSGLCTIAMSWGEQTEAGTDGGDIGSKTTQFNWVFNP